MLSKNQKKKQREKLKTAETFFDFKNPLRKQRSYDFHNVEEEEPHYSSPFDKSNSCVLNYDRLCICYTGVSSFSLCPQVVCKT